MTKLTGTCLCGSVRYDADCCDIKFIMNCHCSNCQKITGSVYGTNIFMPEDKVSITGETGTYTYKADSGADMTRLFCKTCGSPMFGTNSNRPGIMTIRAGTLDQKDVIEPTLNIYCESAVPSTKMDEDVPKHAKMPG